MLRKMAGLAETKLVSEKMRAVPQCGKHMKNSHIGRGPEGWLTLLPQVEAKRERRLHLSCLFFFVSVDFCFRRVNSGRHAGWNVVKCSQCVIFEPVRALSLCFPRRDFCPCGRHIARDTSKLERNFKSLKGSGSACFFGKGIASLPRHLHRRCCTQRKRSSIGDAFLCAAAA